MALSAFVPGYSGGGRAGLVTGFPISPAMRAGCCTIDDGPDARGDGNSRNVEMLEADSVTGPRRLLGRRAPVLEPRKDRLVDDRLHLSPGSCRLFAQRFPNFPRERHVVRRLVGPPRRCRLARCVRRRSRVFVGPIGTLARLRKVVRERARRLVEVDDLGNEVGVDGRAGDATSAANSSENRATMLETRTAPSTGG